MIQNSSVSERPQPGSWLLTPDTVEATYDASSCLLKFALRDTGIGMSPEVIQKLFNAFYQADSSSTRSRGGSGLGLVICKQIMEIMDWRISVESTPGVGSVFWVELPAPETTGYQEQDVQEQVEPTRPLRILIAEHNDATQKILQALLSGEGHGLTLVADGQAAFGKVATEEFDVVIMDIMMPIMDGLTATRRIRELAGRAGGIPIIALTANALQGDRDRYLAAGMTDYLAKPIDVPALFAALARASRLLPHGPRRESTG